VDYEIPKQKRRPFSKMLQLDLAGGCHTFFLSMTFGLAGVSASSVLAKRGCGAWVFGVALPRVSSAAAAPRGRVCFWPGPSDAGGTSPLFFPVGDTWKTRFVSTSNSLSCAQKPTHRSLEGRILLGAVSVRRVGEERSQRGELSAEGRALGP